MRVGGRKGGRDNGPHTAALIAAKNGRQPQKKMVDDLKQKWKTTSKKDFFSIPLIFRGKPFLRLAQLFKIL
jgi:hypothetical protein